MGRPDEVKGQALVCFVTLRPGHVASGELRAALAEHVAHEIGRFARSTRSASPTRCPRPARARSCGGCSRRWRRAPSRRAT
ncbi:MAG: hypothetical protein U0325_07340 [Polyangiales bacterium]